MEHWIVEEIKPDSVRLETPEETTVILARELFPENLRLGDWLIKTEQGYVVDAAQTEHKRAELISRTNRLFERKSRS